MRVLRFAFPLAFVAAAPVAAERGGTVAAGGRVTGRVALSGPLQPERTLEVTRHLEVCGVSVPDESLLLGAGLANVVVYLEDVPGGKDVDLRVRGHLDHLGCRFQPHVQALAVGQVLEIRNLDPIPHAVRATVNGEGTVFSVPLPLQNQVVLQRLKVPGVLSLRSDQGYPWMSGFVLVTKHPYHAVTGPDGGFVLDGVPPGTYTLRAWHETLGTTLRRVVVPPDGEVRLSISIGP